MSQGMRVTTALGLTAKSAGLAATPAATTDQHFCEATRLADTLPCHTEQAESPRWYAWALERFGAPPDHIRERRDGAAKRFEALGGHNPIGGQCP